MASFIINHPFFFFLLLFFLLLFRSSIEFYSSFTKLPLTNVDSRANFISRETRRDEKRARDEKKEIVEISRKFTTFNFGKLVDAIFFLSTVRLKIVENEWNDAILDCTRTNIEFQSTLIEKKFWILNQFPSIFFFVSLQDVFIYFPFFFYKIVDTFLRSNRRFIHCYPHSPKLERKFSHGPR